MAEPGIWDLEQLLRDNPLSGEPVKWTYLVEGGHSTLNVVQAPSFNSPHIHEAHDEVVYILKGQGGFRLGDQVMPCKEGQVVFIPAGTVHTPIMDGYIAALSTYAPHFDPQDPDRKFVD